MHGHKYGRAEARRYQPSECQFGGEFKMFVSILMLSIVLGAGTLANTPEAPPRQGTESVATPKELAGLRERWLGAMKELGVPGMAVVVVRDGQVIMTETLGYRDAEAKLPVTADTAFYIASCTKPFVAMAILTLVDQGKLQLDTPVKSILPRFELSDPTLTQNITIRDLLSHTKGISGGPIVWLDAYTGQITEDRYYHFLKQVPISGRTEYSNVHFTLLGRVIEAVSGQSWKDYLDEKVFQPSNMKSATAYASAMYSGNAAIPCTSVNGVMEAAKTRKTDRTMHAAGGMGASANDLARWLLLHLGGGELDGKRLLSTESMNQMLSTQSKMTKTDGMFPNHQRTGFGLAWNLGSYRGEQLVEHGGGYTGTSAWVTFMPDRKIGVAAMVNSSSRLPFMAVVDVYDRLLGGEPTDLLPKVKAGAASREAQLKERNKKFGANPGKKAEALSLPLKAYAGTYSNIQFGTIEFGVQGDELMAIAGDLSFRVGSLGKDEIELAAEDDKPSGGRFFIEDNKVIAFRVALFEGQDEVVYRRE